MSINFRNLLLLLGIILFFAVAMVLTFQRINARDAVLLPGTTITTSQTSDLYYKIIDEFSTASAPEIQVQASDGSGTNIDRLISGESSFALVQNDVAIYSFQGLKGRKRARNIRYILPVFPESIRLIVPSESAIISIGQLRGKNVCVGAQGSGTYYNATDVLNQINLQESIDYKPIFESPYKCLELANSRDGVDAVFITSHLSPQVDFDTRRVQFPMSIVDNLIERRNYYFKAIDSESGEVELQVYAFLATTAEMSSSQVEAVTTKLLRTWPALKTKWPSLPSVQLKNQQTSIPFHVAARKAFHKFGIEDRSYGNQFLISLWAVLLILCVYAEKQKISYNRLGEPPLKGVAYKIIVKGIGRIAKIVISASVILIFIAVAVTGLRISEQFFARSIDEQSPFLDMGFLDSIVWLFTYISSGFTSDGIYPQSTLGQVITSLLAFFGVAAPITGIIYIWSAFDKQAQRVLQGFGITSYKNHVLICGWNEKAPGIIYTLTGNDVDDQKHVVVVAEFKEKFPLEKYKFNPGYVTYIKGRGSDIKVLERANVDQADSTIILADFSGDESHNMDSILTVMNIHNKSEGNGRNTHICAELEYEENRDLYSACGCNTLIDSGKIIARLASAAVLCPDVIDYVLDIITYHDHDELYSIKVTEENSINEFVGKPIREVELFLMSIGVNVVGLLKQERNVSDLFDATFHANSHLKALVDTRDSRRLLDSDNILIYAANERLKNREQDKIWSNIADHKLPASKFKINPYQSKRILACGDLRELEELKKNIIANQPDDVKFVGIDITEKHLNTYEDVSKHVSGEFDVIVVLVPHEKRVSIQSDTDMHNIDARSILTTRLLQKFHEGQNIEPTMITEIMSIDNKDLFMGAGADVVLPAVMTIERFLAKEVYDKNNVLDYILALLDMSDGIHLHAHSVCENDGFCGNMYKDVLATEIDGLRIVGWLPRNLREELKNKQKDFGYHFKTVIDKKHKTQRMVVGDVLVMIIKSGSIYECFD